MRVMSIATAIVPLWCSGFQAGPYSRLAAASMTARKRLATRWRYLIKISLAKSLSYHHDDCHLFLASWLMWLSSTAQQALHAVLCIAQADGDAPVRVDDIARVMGCPRNYLSKTLHLLTRAGVLRSERGPKGGFRLASPPDRITLARVVAPFEPVGERRCLV